LLEEIDLSRKINKEDYEKLIEPLKIKLSELQRKAKDCGIPIIILFEGWGASGKGTFINELILPLDPRGFSVCNTNKLNEDEVMRPFLWRYWIKTPSKGRIAIFDRSWYRKTSLDRVEKGLEGEMLIKAFQDINSFEKQLTDDGNVIIKFYLHISKKEQAKRFRKLEGNPATSWRVTKEDWKHNEQYDKYIEVIDEMIQETDTDYASWTIVESENKRFATIKIFSAVIKAIEEKMENAALEVRKDIAIVNKAFELKSINASVLDAIDLTKDITKEEYKHKLKEYQDRLRELEHLIYMKRIPIIILYEGWDAAGKGGNIKRVTENLDPRGYQVIPIAAPSIVEKSHHYLWRFWNEIPKAGHIGIFDRSWYGRVMVERIESFCSEGEWKRAYKEINDMEEQLTNFGVVLIKLWLHISPEEQLIRFNERQNTPVKSWKITEEDWRNREKWDSYKVAVDEMLIRTSTTYAPWNIVESNSKYYARIKTLKTIIDAIEKVI